MSELIVPSSERSSRVSLSLSSARRGASVVFSANGFTFKHASDLSFFEGSAQANDLFHRFMETWLRFLFKEPPPHQGSFTYASVAAFRTEYPLASWFDSVDLRFRIPTNTFDTSSDEFFVSPAFVVESDLRSGALVSSRNRGSLVHPSSRCVLIVIIILSYVHVVFFSSSYIVFI